MISKINTDHDKAKNTSPCISAVTKIAYLVFLISVFIPQLTRGTNSWATANSVFAVAAVMSIGTMVAIAGRNIKDIKNRKTKKSTNIALSIADDEGSEKLRHETAMTIISHRMFPLATIQVITALTLSKSGNNVISAIGTTVATGCMVLVCCELYFCFLLLVLIPAQEKKQKTDHPQDTSPTSKDSVEYVTQQLDKYIIQTGKQEDYRLLSPIKNGRFLELQMSNGEYIHTGVILISKTGITIAYGVSFAAGKIKNESGTFCFSKNGVCCNFGNDVRSIMARDIAAVKTLLVDDAVPVRGIFIIGGIPNVTSGSGENGFEVITESTLFKELQAIEMKSQYKLSEDTLNAITEKLKLVDRAAVNTERPVCRPLHVTTTARDEKFKNLSPEEMGQLGEREVDYRLKWWLVEHPEYHIVVKDCASVYSDNCIRLVKWPLVAEPQEYDHILVGPIGVIHIETKTYDGLISIKDNETWLRANRPGAPWRQIESPLFQVSRHDVLLKSVLGPNVQTFPLICIANSSTTIAHTEKSDIPVVGIEYLASTLNQLIENNAKPLSEEQVMAARVAIEDAKIRVATKVAFQTDAN